VPNFGGHRTGAASSPRPYGAWPCPNTYAQDLPYTFAIHRQLPGFPELETFDQAAVEADVLARWEREDTFRQSVERRAGAPAFVFYEGPPTANGKPGIHHVMARAIKDAFCRYKTMRGFQVERKGGWDTHGLPVEIEVEKALGLEGRHQIEEYGIARYNAACRESVLRYKDLWDDLTLKMGYWVDLSDPYVTFENEYIESVWALLKRIHQKGLLYRGHKNQWYSPANGTVLSSHEVAQGYREVQDPSVTVRFPVAGEAGVAFLAWTTTPWTLPANAALAVGANIRYLRVTRPLDAGGTEQLIVAADRAGAVLGEDYEVEAEMPGSALVGMRYVPPFATFVERLGPDVAWRVVAADFVTTEDGTGVVHIAPAYGADDSVLGRAEGLPVLNPLRPDGTFDDTLELIAGDWFKDADKKVVRDLRDRGLMFHQETYLHNYPHDWRKGTPLVQYPVESWFIRTTAVRDRMVELNRTINWQPEGIGQGRFGQWLENNVDWAISRMRFWGTPLPMWVSDRDPEQVEVMGSIAELLERAGATPDEAINPALGTIDLHRPFVDAFTWSDGMGGTMRRVPDLLDVWFDSGAMPFAQWHYPIEDTGQFSRSFPADFIAEGVDQTRGWFYTLHAISTLLQDSVAYRNVLVNGLVLDKAGEKMSKSKGNTVDPFGALAAHGADPVRWMMMASSPPWENLRYADEAIVDTRRGFFGTLVNTYRFLATYANIDGYDPAAPAGASAPAELDRWVLSRLQATIVETARAYDDYHPTRAARAVERFVDDLSNWYVRRSRRRFWKSGDDADKRTAYDTLYRALDATAHLMAPIAPFTADWLHHSLTGGESVHLAAFPEADASLRDEALERRMALARGLASMVLSLRNEAGINVRQPLARMLVVTGAGGVDAGDLRAVTGIVLDEVNVKRLDTVSSAEGVIERTAKPNFRALGKRLGPRMKAASEAIAALDAGALARYESEGTLTIDVAGAPFELEDGDLEVAAHGLDGQLVAQQEVEGPGVTPLRITVALDSTIADDLRREGLAREFVNRVQNLRKAAGYDVADRITVEYSAGGDLAEALAAHADYIRSETLATTLQAAPAPAGDRVQDVEIGEEQAVVALRRAAGAGD